MNRRVTGSVARKINFLLDVTTLIMNIMLTTGRDDPGIAATMSVCNTAVYVLCLSSALFRTFPRNCETGGIFRMFSRYSVCLLVTNPCAPMYLNPIGTA